MDFLRRIGRFIGGAAQGVGRAFQQAPQVISRSVLDAERARQQAIAQVQRNLPRFQAPPPPRIQLPQIQIPRVQLPQAPRVDLGAVSRALGNYYNRTALSKVAPGIQRELPKIDRNIQSFNERLLGGIGRTAIRTGEFVLPGKTENISEAMIQRLFPEAGTAAGRRGLTPLADPRSFGGRLGTGAKAAVDVAGIVLPSTAATKGLQATQLAQKGLQGGRLARLGTLAATEAIGGIPASAASIAQARGQQKPVDLKREIGTGLLIDAGTPLGIKLLGKGYRAIRGAISNAPTAVIEEAAKGIKGIKPQQAIQQAVIAGVPIAKTTRPVATVAKAPQVGPTPRPIAENVYPIQPGVGRIKPPAGSVVDATPGLTARAQQQFAKARKVPSDVATAGLNADFQLNVPGNIQKYVLDTKGNPIGGIYGFYEGPDRAILRNVYVLPGERGKNAASKLIKAFEEEARINGVSEIKLTSKADALYKKLGYKIDTTRTPTPGTNYFTKTIQPPRAQRIAQEVPASAMQPKAPKGQEALFAEARKYKSADEFVDSKIFRDAHAAPGKSDLPVNKRIEEGGDFNLTEVIKGKHNQPSDYFDSQLGPRYYGYDNQSGMESLTAINNVKRGSQTITAYRVVPNNVKINKLIDGDWISFSQKYADDHGLARFGEGEYKIIKQEVSPKDVWWDGNDIREWGFDTGKTNTLSRGELRDIWNKANKPTLPVKPIYETVPESAMRPKGPKGVEPTPRAMQPVSPGQETARFATQLENDVQVPNEVLQDIFPGYTRLPNEQVYADAVSMLNKNQAQFIENMISKKLPSTAENNAAAMIAMRNLIDEGGKDSLKKATRLAQATIAQGTDAGRAVQIFSRWRATTPEGAIIKAQKTINEYNERVANKLIGKKQFLELTPEKQTKIVDMANEVQKFAEGTRERQVAEALLFKEITDIAPPSIGQKLSQLQYLAQLLNVKTALRNVLGNTTASGANDTANVIAAGIDGALYRLGLVKQRTVTLPNVLIGLKGFGKGAKYAIEDVKLGIKTTGTGGSYDLQPQVFKNYVLRKLENALGYELSVPDKAFYQRAFDISIDNQMKAAAKSGVKLDAPTAAMKAQANEEGLYQTFQNNSALAKGLSAVKRGLNFKKEFGIGDIVLKYPKTPGNIISQGIDFTPVGFIRGSYDLIKAIRNELPATAQRNAVLNIGRGLTGTGLITLGAGLASAGVITASKEADKKRREFERVSGAGPFTINLTALQRLVQGQDATRQKGDLIVNYDWLQPNAIQLSMGANFILSPQQKDKNSQFIDNLISSTNASVNTVIEQPVLSGVSRLLSKVSGGGITQSDVVGAITDAVANIPSSFIPSTVNQIGQSLDKFSRETRAANPITEAYNKTIARIPGLRQTLPMKYDVLGKPINTFDPEAGGNNFFNVFLNPAFPRKVKEDAAIRLINDLYEKTGSTEQFPKVTGDTVDVTKNGKKEKLKLNTDQISEYQKYVGERTNQAYNALANDPAFTSLSPEEQTNKLSNVIENINTAARVQLFGHSPSKIEYSVQNILNGGDPTVTGGKPKLPKVKVSKARRARVGRGRRGGGRGRVAKVKVPRIKTPRVTVRGLPRVPTVKAKKVSFKVPKPKAGPRKTVKIKQG